MREFGDFAIPGLLWGLALLLGWYELRAFAAASRSDPHFPYTRRRLARRLFGVAVLAGTGATLLAWTLWPPVTARIASLYVALMTTEVALMFAVAILDLRDSGRRRRRESEEPPDT